MIYHEKLQNKRSAKSLVRPGWCIFQIEKTSSGLQDSLCTCVALVGYMRSGSAPASGELNTHLLEYGTLQLEEGVQTGII